jgi:hypothetical protein
MKTVPIYLIRYEHARSPGVKLLYLSGQPQTDPALAVAWLQQFGHREIEVLEIPCRVVE